MISIHIELRAIIDHAFLVQLQSLFVTIHITFVAKMIKSTHSAKYNANFINGYAIFSYIFDASSTQSIPVVSHILKISSTITFHMYLALSIIIIHMTQYNIIVSPLFILASSHEKNNLYAHNIHISTHITITIGVIISDIILNIKILIESHHQIVEFG